MLGFNNEKKVEHCRIPENRRLQSHPSFENPLCSSSSPPPVEVPGTIAGNEVSMAGYW